MTWIDQFVAQHEAFESPLSFWRWSGLASISAVVKDNIWLDRYIYKLYPNIYVMFHAESGLKKGPPVSAANQLVKVVNNTRIISGRSSIQGILKELGTAYSQPGGHVLKKSVAFICSSELSSSIVEDPVAIKILTDLYDRNYRVGEWKSLLKMEQFELIDPTVTMLTATNEAMSEDFLTRAAIKGGYVARTFIIYESKRNRPNSLLVPPKIKIDYKCDAEYLKKLAALKGGFEPLGAREKSDLHCHEYYDRYAKETHYLSNVGFIYQQWYDDFISAMDEGDVKDATGTLNRFGDSVLKVAMLLSLSRTPELRIDETSMHEAIGVCEQLIGNVRQTTMSRSGGDESNASRKLVVINELLKRDSHNISRAQLLKKYWMQGNANEWDECIASLAEAKMIVIESVGNQVLLKMIGEQLKEMQDFMKGRMK